MSRGPNGLWKMQLMSLQSLSGSGSTAPIALDSEIASACEIPSPFDRVIAKRRRDHGEERQALTNLVTDKGIWCGALTGVEPAQLLQLEGESKTELELVPLSLAKINWCHFWLDCDKDRDDKAWKMMNVMLVKTGEKYSRRVAVGQILKEAGRPEAAAPELCWMLLIWRKGLVFARSGMLQCHYIRMQRTRISTLRSIRVSRSVHHKPAYPIRSKRQ